MSESITEAFSQIVKNALKSFNSLGLALLSFATCLWKRKLFWIFSASKFQEPKWHNHFIEVLLASNTIFQECQKLGLYPIKPLCICILRNWRQSRKVHHWLSNVVCWWNLKNKHFPMLVHQRALSQCVYLVTARLEKMMFFAWNVFKKKTCGQF
jgi:hypothetical protein